MLNMKNELNRNNGRQNTIIFLNNAIDKEIQSLLLPLDLLQNIMLLPKYSIRDNFIYPNSMVLKYIGLCAAIVYSASGAYRTYGFYNDRIIRVYFEGTYIMSYLDFLFYAGRYFMIYNLNVVQTNSNVSFVLRYQKIHRFFKNSTYIKCFNFWSWFSVIFIVFWLIFILATLLVTRAPFYLIIYFTFVILFDLCSIHASRLITLLKNSVVLLNVEIKSLEYTRVDQGHCNKLWKTYLNILKCYDSYICFHRHHVSAIFYVCKSSSFGMFN